MRKTILFLFTVFTILSVYSQGNTPLLTLNSEMHTNQITDIATDAEGKYILTTSIDKTAKLWEATTGKLLRTYRVPIEGNEGMLFAGTVSNKGQIVAISGLTGPYYNMHLYLFDIQSGNLLQTIKGIENVVYTLAFSPNDQFLVVGFISSLGESIHIYRKDDVSKEFKLHKSLGGFKANTACRSLSFDGTGRLAAASPDNELIRLYDKDFNLINIFSGSGSKPSSVNFSPDGKKIAVAFSDKAGIDVISADNLKLLYQPAMGEGRNWNNDFTSVAFSSDGKFLYSAGTHFGFVNEEQWTLIRKWENGGMGSYTDYAASRNAISKLAPAKGKNWQSDVLFAGRLPDFGKISSSGTKSLYKSVPNSHILNALDFYLKGNEVFSRVTHNERFSFSPLHKQLVIMPVPSDERIIEKNWLAGNLEQLMNRNSNALALLQNTVQYLPNYPRYANIYFSIGYVHLVLGSYDEAFKAYSQGIDLNKRNHQMLQEGHIRDAIKKLEKGVKDVPEMQVSKILELLTKTEIGRDMDKTFYSDSRGGTTVTDWYGAAPKINNLSVSFEERNVRASSVDVSSSGKRVVFGTNSYLYCFDEKAQKIWETSSASARLAVKISEDDRYVVAAEGNGLISWFDMQTGTQMMTLFVNGSTGQWIAWNPEGYFDCSNGAEGLIGWHINQGKSAVPQYFPVGQFYEEYYTPNLAAKILSGEEFMATRQKNIINSFTLPPLVEILTPSKGSTQANSKQDVVVRVTDQGGGIDEIRLYHNDKLIDGTQRGFKPVAKEGSSETKSFTISLVDGVNRIKATALNTQRTESLPHEIEVKYKAPTQVKPNMYILAIGINEYLNPRYNLNYAKNDANAFVNALQKGASGIFEKITLLTIYDSQATRSGIVGEIQKVIQQARPEDVFVFYYAGHGVMSSGSTSEKPDFYLVPHNVTKMYEADDELKSKGISAKEIGEFSKSIRSQKQLFILDACQSGGAIQSFAMRGAAEEKAIAQLSRSTGTYFIAASGTEQFATEVATLGHGIFTYSIIEALKGACKSTDGRLTVNLLKGCVEDMVPELSTKYKGSPQFPTGYGFGQDFPIVIIGK
jgi:WD40 repeat protein